MVGLLSDIKHVELEMSKHITRQGFFEKGILEWRVSILRYHFKEYNEIVGSVVKKWKVYYIK